MDYKITKEMRETFKRIFDQGAYDKALAPVYEAIERSKTFQTLTRRLKPFTYDVEYYDNSIDFLCDLEVDAPEQPDYKWVGLSVSVSWASDEGDMNQDAECRLETVKMNVIEVETGRIVCLCSINPRTCKLNAWINELVVDDEGKPKKMRTKDDKENVAKHSKAATVHSRSSRSDMKKWLVFSWEGYCASPNEEGNENYQILGCVSAKNEVAAIRKFVKENDYLINEGFDPYEMGVVRLHGDVAMDDIFIAREWDLNL
ncbi:MAG: hypothetical protein NC453_28950 [Muribaculum sp.]|nr:hypothetical protein [Muribaculum sp.]